MDSATLRDAQRAAWSHGDYGTLARLFQPVADALVRAARVGPGDEVLDVAAGTGNVAAAAAAAGAARVVASDLSPELIAVGRERTAATGLDVEWLEADAEDLPFPDATFDCALSALGAMFAPHPEVATAELLRVVRPGGRVGMATWTAEGFCGRQLEVFERTLPRPPGAPSVADWGREEVLRERLGEDVELSRDAIAWDFPDHDAAWGFMERTVPPIAQARARLPPDAWDGLRAELRALNVEFDRGEGERVLIPAECVLAVAPRA